MLQILGHVAGESYLLSKKVLEHSDGDLMREVYKLMIRTPEEAIIRKCMRLYILISTAGCSLMNGGPLSTNELQQFNEEKKSILSARGEKLLSKFQSAVLKPAASKKQLATNEDALNWEEINKIRKATRGCMTIMKDKINA